MRRIFVPLSFLLAINVFGQTFQDSTQTEKLVSTETYQPVLTLTKEQIERFPAASFMELVNGAFAFVFADPLLAKDFTFVIDGFVTINPNAINLSQIQQIQFYPAGTTATYGSLTKKGTFVISTLEGVKSGMGFSTKTGLLLKNDDITATTVDKEKHPAVFSLNELHYAKITTKTSINSALSYLRNGHPYYSYTTAKVDDYKNNKYRLRFSNTVTHQINNQLSLLGGLFLLHNKRKYEGKEFFTTYISEGSSKTGTDYLAAVASLLYQPLPKLQNSLSAEASSYKDKFASNSMFEQFFYGQQREKSWRTASSKGRQTTYSLANHTSYNLIQSPAFLLKTELAIRFRQWKQKGEETTIVKDDGGMQLSFANAKSSFTKKSWQATPGMHLNWQEVLKANLHLQYEDFSNSVFPGALNDEQKFFPGLGIQLSLKNLFLKESSISDLSISSNYLEYWNELDRQGILDEEIWLSIAYMDGFFTHYSPTISKRWLNSLNLSILKGRIALKLNYLTEEESIVIAVPFFIPGGQIYTYNYQNRPLKRKGKGIELKTQIIDLPKYRWHLQGSLFNEAYQLKDYNNPLQPSIPSWVPAARTGVINIFKDEKPHWTGSIRTEAAYNRLFLQVSALLAFNDYGHLNNGLTGTNYFDNHGLNHFLVGYKIPLHATKLIETLEVNLQTRNLVKRKHSASSTQLYPYYGVGAHITL